MDIAALKPEMIVILRNNEEYIIRVINNELWLKNEKKSIRISSFNKTLNHKKNKIKDIMFVFDIIKSKDKNVKRMLYSRNERKTLEKANSYVTVKSGGTIYSGNSYEYIDRHIRENKENIELFTASGTKLSLLCYEITEYGYSDKLITETKTEFSTRESLVKPN